VTPTVSISKALSDPQLLGKALEGESWKPWRTLLIAAMGEKLTEEERALFKSLTGREHEPLQRVDEFAAVVGRRGGKSRAMSVLATYIAGLCEHSDALVPGEKGVLLCVALDQWVAAIILNYAEALFERSPILRQLITNRTQDALELNNGISIEVRPASFRRLRGPTYVAVIADELAYWYTEANYANPDVEVLNAVEPGLATTGGPLILASSPYAKSGVLWDVYRKHYGARVTGSRWSPTGRAAPSIRR
jgi:phage terminase large subunit-like protein